MSRIVGRYEILQQLGEGGMADVFLARQLDLDRLVALKELRSLGGSDPAFAKRFLREARMAGSLSHPNIVTVHDFIEWEGTPFIAMEYMERGSLRPWIGRMSLAQIAGVLEGVLGGLAYAGERGIVHRDIKPENIMIGADGRVKIADFGIAKARHAFQTTGPLTVEGTALGTPNYMAPEQAAADEVGPWTDIYASGVMAFEMFVGRPPFADTPQPLVVLMRQVNDPVPRITDIDPRIDPRIGDWVAWLTAKDPAERPQNGTVAWDRFEEIAGALLSARWRRGALLIAGTQAAPAAQASAAAAAAPPVPTPVTQPLDDSRYAPTVAANPGLLGIDRTSALGAPAAAPGKAPGRRSRRVAVIAGAAAVLLAVAATAASRDSAPPAGHAKRAATPKTRARTTTSTTTQPVANPAASDLSTQARDAAGLAKQYRRAASKIDALPASAQNALLAGLTRKVADAYARAAAAARRGDAEGYATELAAALAAKNELDSAARAPAPASSATPAAQQQEQPAQLSACAGDSQSDDPSDDDCGGGEP